VTDTVNTFKHHAEKIAVRRKELEQMLLNEVAQFERDTGLTVDALDVQHVETVGRTPTVIAVRASVGV